MAEYVGLTALLSAGLLVAGLAFTSAYLSAWQIPLSAVQLDPFATALRSDAAIYNAVLIAAVAVLSGVAIRRLVPGAYARTGAALLVLVALAIAVTAGFVLYWGVALAIAAGLVIGFGRHQGWLSGWRLPAVFGIGALVSGYLTGYSVGLQVRDDPSRQTPVLLTTAVPVAGLDKGVEEGAAWHYDGLYFVYRDAAVLYVAETGSGSAAWGIAEFNLRSFSTGASE
jgi:hypothetical protein